MDRQFLAVGQSWFREHELDVPGLTREGLVADECKFTSDPVSEGVLADLERRAAERDDVSLYGIPAVVNALPP